MRYHIDALRFKSLKNTSRTWDSPYIKMLKISNGGIRILDTKEGKETILIIPDGPNLIEHYFPLLKNLQQSFRVVIFDLPGFGFSFHDGNYDYSFEKTNQLILEILDALNIKRTNIVFPCANGLYGLAFTKAFPEKVKNLILLQIPALGEMSKWTDRTVPSFLKIPYIGQMIMPFMELKFAESWYNYALPKNEDKTPYSSVAVKGIQDGGKFCLCSLVQGLSQEYNTDLTIDSSIPTTLIYGDKDFTHRPTNFESILEYNKNTDIIKFENCGHFPDLERPKAYLQILKEKIL